MSEPRTPDEFLREISSAFQALYPSADALDNAVGAIEARDEQIREQEMARVRALLRGVRDGAREACAANKDQDQDLALAAERRRTAEFIARELGTDLEGTDDA